MTGSRGPVAADRELAHQGVVMPFLLPESDSMGTKDSYGVDVTCWWRRHLAP